MGVQVGRRTREGGGGGDVDEAAGVAGHDAGDDEPAQAAELGVRGADHARRRDHGGRQEEKRLGRRHSPAGARVASMWLPGCCWLSLLVY